MDEQRLLALRAAVSEISCQCVAYLRDANLLRWGRRCKPNPGLKAPGVQKFNQMKEEKLALKIKLEPGVVV